MSEARFIVGDVFEKMAEIPDGSVDLVVTSPPFLALRSYLPTGHPDKHKEIGSEPTPAAFLSTLLALTREWRRVLAPHGSICVELGDTYAGGNAVGTDHKTKSSRYPNGRGVDGDVIDCDKVGPGWPLAKSLCLLPSLYPASLAYGHNLLEPSDLIDPWRVRNLIVWHRPNPPVGALGDKVRPSTSYVTVACTSAKRWFDLDAERGPGSPNTHARLANGVASRPTTGKKADNPNNNYGSMAEVETAGAPPLDCWYDTTEPDVWTIPTAPFAGAHYATFPPALPRKLINLMCPRSVCLVCGEARRRITEQTEEYRAARDKVRAGTYAASGQDKAIGRVHGGNGDRWANAAAQDIDKLQRSTTLGWTDCGHNTWRRGIVLDPFAGSGTTLQAASELGRDSIGIDLDERNLDLAYLRCGLFLTETVV